MPIQAIEKKRGRKMTTPGTYNLSALTVVALVALIGDARDRKVDVTAGENDGEFTVTASKRSKRAEARVARDARTAEIKVIALESLEKARPLKIAPLVEEVAARFGVTDKEKIHDLRADVLVALRELRDAGTLLAQNPTGSNFHVRWTLAASPDEFPVPQPKPAVEPKAASEKKRGRPSKSKGLVFGTELIETLEVHKEDEAA